MISLKSFKVSKNQRSWKRQNQHLHHKTRQTDALQSTFLPLQLEEAANRNAGHCLRKLKRYQEAKECYLKALALMRELTSEETSDFITFIMKDLITYHKQHEIHLSPNQLNNEVTLNHSLESQLYSALGFVSFHMMQCQEAIQYFHQALALNSEDILTNQMLRIAMESVFRAPAETTWLHTGMEKEKDAQGVFEQISSLIDGCPIVKKTLAKEQPLSTASNETNNNNDDDDEMVLD